jgi:hypothetical protein
VLAYLPALDLVLARREEVDELDGAEAGGDDLRQRADDGCSGSMAGAA